MSSPQIAIGALSSKAVPVRSVFYCLRRLVNGTPETFSSKSWPDFFESATWLKLI